MEVEDPGYRNLANLRWMLNHFGIHGGGMNDFMAKYLDKVTFAEFKGFVSQDTKVIAGMLSSARAALDLWSDPDIAELTATDSMDIGRLRDEKTVVYLIVPEDEMDYFSLILNLFYTVCFRHCLREWDAEDERRNEGKEPVFFFLDEFGNLGKDPQVSLDHHDAPEAAVLGEPDPSGSRATAEPVRPRRGGDHLLGRVRKQTVLLGDGHGDVRLCGAGVGTEHGI